LRIRCNKKLTKLVNFYTNDDMKTTVAYQHAYITQTYAQLLIAYVQQYYPAPDQLLAQLNLAALSLHPGKVGRIPLLEFTEKLHQVQGEMRRLGLDADNLAIHMAKLINPAHFGVLGYLILACANMAEALALLNRYARLLDDHYTMTTEIDFDRVVLSWDVTAREDVLFFEMGLASMVQFMSNLTGLAPPLTIVHLTSAPKADRTVVDDFFQCPVLYEQPLMRLEFATHLLATPIKQADKALLDLLSIQADQALAQLPQGREWEQKVRQEIVRLCHEAVPTLDKVASNLFITPRTLQRHLATEGLRFQPLLDETRRHLAEQYLHEGRLQLTDIAELLGYSDQSALTRAFKRWTGNTPHVVRKGG
jgi:AraC-like DNA-binding protein